jgi:hypothetical protein
MLVKNIEEGSFVSGVNIFWWLAVAGPCCVGIEVGLPPFEGELGFGVLGKSGGKNRQDAGVLVQAGAYEVEEDCLDLSFAAGG